MSVERITDCIVDALEQAAFVGEWEYPSESTALESATLTAEIVVRALAGYLLLSPEQVAQVRGRGEVRCKGYPEEWGPVCFGCGGEEYRIDGFCSIECRDFHNDDDYEWFLAMLDAKEEEK